MSLPVPTVWLPRTVTLLVAVLTAASVSFWVQRWRQQAPQLIEPAAMGQLMHVDSDAIVRLLGSTGPSPPAQAPGQATRFVLAGVLASPSGSGVALIAVDGKPARIFQVGATVTEALLLRSVGARHVTLVSTDGGGAALTLELPALKKIASSSKEPGSAPGQAGVPGNARSASAFAAEQNHAEKPAAPAFQNRSAAD